MFVNTPRDWGNIVRDRRIDLGMTQSDLAERIGKARQWVVRFESGHAGSSNLDSLVKLLDVLELEVDLAVADDSADPDPLFTDAPSAGGVER
ncbi:helix-turn-helix transcriptional regulator [Agromyces archimandritae]|nr:helix-turn-helix transcriptional regulator [Agromyces archimandritae]